ncbi:beta strand repeat-containing protein [Ekhidna sp. To15]|uniref:beta strand repeat-containing protein n=1 Tax=Ekhidna sp. To15 TaxID=3395267 RepID=UPI003F525E20
MKHQIIRYLGLALLSLCIKSYSQSVGIGTETPNSNAILELVAPDANQGLLVPRLRTAERTATAFTNNLSATDNGLLIYDLEDQKFYFWMTDDWVEIASGNIDALPDQTGQNNRYLTTDGTTASWSDVDFASLANVPTGLADGDDDTQLSDADIAALGYIKNPDDADADASNEFQDLTLLGNTLSLTNSGVNVDLSPFAGTNTDNQTISLAGTDLTITGGNTLDVSSLVNDADADPTNEDQTVSAGTGISINNVGEDFEVTNTAPDQTVSLANGGNVIITGTYPNFTLAVPNNLDNDPTNEDQTVSAGTGISINNVGEDFAVTNTAPDQTVSLANGGNVTITGTYPNFTLAVPTNNDNSATNEIELPTQTGQNGNFLTTNGSSPSWSSINETQWNTNGTSINYTTGNVNIGSGTIPTSSLQLSTNNPSTTTPQLTIQESNATSDASINFNRSGTNITMGIDATDGFFKLSGANSLGSSDRIIMDSQGTLGVGVTPNAQLHVQTNSTESSTARLTNTSTSAASKIGIMNELDNQGTATKTGLWNDITGTTSETGDVKGIYNIISPTDGASYGVHSQINSAGTGARYGTFSDVRGAAANSSIIYGFRTNVDHDGSGDAFGLQVNMFGSTSGRQYGIFTNGENFNYFEGNVGIGDAESDVELTIQSFNLNSILPLLRLNSGAGTSDAGISFSIPGGNEFVVGVDATDNSFKISDNASLGFGNRLTIDATGNLGIAQSSPSARLDVVGTTELNGAVDVQSTVDITGLLTVTNDIEIPETNAYTYASAQTRQITYHPTDFKLMKFDGGSVDLVVGNFTNPYTYYSGGSGSLAYATAPVKLPEGAVVTEVEAWVVDNDATASNFVRVNLYRSQIGVINSNNNMAQIETSSESAAVQALDDTTIFSQTIDNTNYSYRLLFSARDNSSTLQLHGVRISYSVTQVD